MLAVLFTALLLAIDPAASALGDVPAPEPESEHAKTEIEELFNSAQADWKAGKCEQAIPALKTLAAAGYRGSEAARAMRTCYETAYGIEGAVAKLEEEIRANPNDALAHTSLGVFYLAQALKDPAKKEASRVELTKAVQIAPKDLDARFNLAFWYTQVGQPHAAIQELDSLLKDDPENRRALTELCYLHFLQQNDAKTAEPFCYRALVGDEANEQTALALGMVRMRLGDLDGAEAAFKTVLDANENAHGAKVFYGVSRIQRGDFETAQRTFEEVLARDPKNSDARVGLARTFQARKQHGKAVEQFRIAYAQDGGGMLFGALVKAYLQQYFYAIIFALLALMGLLLWKYLNVKVPEAPSRPLMV